MLIVGIGFTVTETVWADVQEPLFPVTVYTVVPTPGVTVLGFAVDPPGDQVYPPPAPDAVSVVVCPEQSGLGDAPALMVGVGVTVMLFVCVVPQAAEIPTVYVTGKVPAPDVPGQNEVPETPVPDHDPPAVPLTVGGRLTQAPLLQRLDGGVQFAE